MGKRKDDMEVAERQQFLPAGCGPFFSGYLLALGAMSIATGMIADALSATVVAFFDMSAEIGGAAV